MYDPSWDDLDGFDDSKGDGLFHRIKAELHPWEYLVWADRPVLPRFFGMRFIPALFIAVVAVLSGFSLAAMFGLIGQEWLDLKTFAIAVGLAPCVLGGMIVSHLFVVLLRKWLLRRELSRTIYAITDHRAIVAKLERSTGRLVAASLHPEEIGDLRRFENPDGSGDLYFLGSDEIEQWLPHRFQEVPRVGFVESLVRETLINTDEDWWKLGARPAY